MMNVKTQFEILRTNPDVSYLDNASSTLTHDNVLAAMDAYYKTYRANIHRGLYKFSDTATQKYEQARATVAEFIGAKTNEIVFTSGSTHSLNMLAYGLCKELEAGDNIVLTEMEHHANMVPWIALSKQYGFEIRYIPVVDYKLDMSIARKLIDKNTKVVSCTMISNTLGTINPVCEIIALAKNVDAISILDAAQAIAHMKIDVRKLDCDFLVCSGHKMYGPTGIGVLYGKMNRLEKLDPYMYGGGMIQEVSLDNATWTDVPHRFEGGTPHIAGAIGLGAAVVVMNKLDWDELQTHENKLTQYAINQLQDEVNIIGLKTTEHRNGVISFVIDGVHPHDVADILDKHGVAVRAGHHCTEPLMKTLKLTGTVRASIGIYNTKEDIDKLVFGIKKVKEVFS